MMKVAAHRRSYDVGLNRVGTTAANSNNNRPPPHHPPAPHHGAHHSPHHQSPHSSSSPHNHQSPLRCGHLDDEDNHLMKDDECSKMVSICLNYIYI